MACHLALQICWQSAEARGCITAPAVECHKISGYYLYERGGAALADLSRITHNPRVMGGKPCIRGLRVTVGTIVGLLASDHTQDDILQQYPYLEPGDISAALAYAAWRSEEVEVPLPRP